jgi:hypothetical protein
MRREITEKLREWSGTDEDVRVNNGLYTGEGDEAEKGVGYLDGSGAGAGDWATSGARGQGAYGGRTRRVQRQTR